MAEGGVSGEFRVGRRVPAQTENVLDAGGSEAPHLFRHLRAVGGDARHVRKRRHAAGILHERREFARVRARRAAGGPVGDRDKRRVHGGDLADDALRPLHRRPFLGRAGRRAPLRGEHLEGQAGPPFGDNF